MRNVFRSLSLIFVISGYGGIWAGIAAGATATSSSPSAAGYDGWVRIQGRTLVSEETGEEPEPSDNAMEMYINKARGEQYHTMAYPGRKMFRYSSAQTKEIREYDSQTNILGIGKLHPRDARRIGSEIAGYPLTVDDILGLLKKTGAEIVQQTEAREGKLDRVEIAFMGGSLCAQAKEQGGKEIVWVDPKTRLIHKMHTGIVEREEMTYTYIKPIRDLYDLGVPRTAKVIDFRPTPEAAVLLDRLDRRFDNDYGNYVAVLTETDHRKSWGVKKMFLHLYARQGLSALNVQYSFDAQEYPDSPMHKVPGWPKPEVKTVLDLAARTIPLFFYTTDGKTAWNGTYNQVPESPIRLVENQNSLKKNPLIPQFRLADHVWKGRDSLSLWGYGAPADVVRDPKRPGLIGLRLRIGEFAEPIKSGQREERVYWYDPSRDDMPVESIRTAEVFRAKGKPTTITFKYRFFEHAKLPDGRWFPVHWEVASTKKEADGSTDGYTREFYMQLFPGMTLNKIWYASRQKGLEAMGVKTK